MSRLRQAIEGRNNWLAMQLLTENTGLVNQKNKDDETPLFPACSCHNFTMMKFLLENGAELNVKDVHDHTPLSTFIGSGYRRRCECKETLRILGMLLEAGADPSADADTIWNKVGFGAEYEEMLRLLLSYGLDIHAKVNLVQAGKWALLGTIRRQNAGFKPCSHKEPVLRTFSQQHFWCFNAKCE